MGPANPVKDFMNFRIPESVVMHAAFSKNGEWLVTVRCFGTFQLNGSRYERFPRADRRIDGRTPHLKFWLLDSITQQYAHNAYIPIIHC